MHLRHGAGFILFGLGIWFFLPLEAGGQADDKKPAEKRASEDDIRKAREEVKRLADEVDKQADKLYDAQRSLRKAQDRLDELEGRPYPRRFGDARRFPPGRDRRPEPSRPPQLDPKAAADLEKRLDRIMKDLEDMRKEIRKPSTPQSK